MEKNKKIKIIISLIFTAIIICVFSSICLIFNESKRKDINIENSNAQTITQEKGKQNLQISSEISTIASNETVWTVDSSGSKISGYSDINDALRYGSKIKLQADITTSEEISTIYTDVTIDLNGFTIKSTYTPTDSHEGIIYMSNRDETSKLNIINSNKNKKGTIESVNKNLTIFDSRKGNIVSTHIYFVKLENIIVKTNMVCNSDTTGLEINNCSIDGNILTDNSRQNYSISINNSTINGYISSFSGLSTVTLTITGNTTITSDNSFAIFTGLHSKITIDGDVTIRGGEYGINVGTGWTDVTRSVDITIGTNNNTVDNNNPQIIGGIAGIGTVGNVNKIKLYDGQIRGKINAIGDSESKIKKDSTDLEAATGKSIIESNIMGYNIYSLEPVTEPEGSIIIAGTNNSKPTSKLLGDVNLDGYITQYDARFIIYESMHKGTLTGQAKINADIDKDGVIDILDCMEVMRAIEGISNIIQEPEYKKVSKGSTVYLKAYNVDDINNAINNSNLQWSSTNPSIATVNSSGQVTINGIGNTIITVSSTLGLDSFKIQGINGNLTVKYDGNGGNVSTSNKNVTYGETYGQLATATWNGHRFDGWYTQKTGGEKIEATTLVSTTGTQTLYAHWTALTASYTVKHYKQKTDGSFPSTPDETTTGTGNIGSEIPDSRKTYTGFQTPALQHTTISEDGNATISYNYYRNKHKFTLNTATGVSTSGSSTSGQHMYGEKITLKASVSDGYIWTGWTKSGTSVSFTLSSTDTSFTMPDGDVTITPTARVANYVAQVSSTGTKYESLQEAVNACPNNRQTTITILYDIDNKDMVNVSSEKNIIINLNEYIIQNRIVNRRNTLYKRWYNRK